MDPRSRALFLEEFDQRLGFINETGQLTEGGLAVAAVYDRIAQERASTSL